MRLEKAEQLNLSRQDLRLIFDTEVSSVDPNFVPRMDVNGDAIVKVLSTDPLIVPGALAWGQTGFSLPGGRVVYISSSSECSICHALGGHSASGCAVAYRRATTGEKGGGVTPLLSFAQLRHEAARQRYMGHGHLARVSASAPPAAVLQEAPKPRAKAVAPVSNDAKPKAHVPTAASHTPARKPRAAVVVSNVKQAAAACNPRDIAVAPGGMGKRASRRAATRARAAGRVANHASSAEEPVSMTVKDPHSLLAVNPFEALLDGEPEPKEDSDEQDMGGGAFYPGLDEPKIKKLSKKQMRAATAEAGKLRTRALQKALAADIDRYAMPAKAVTTAVKLAAPPAALDASPPGDDRANGDTELIASAAKLDASMAAAVPPVSSSMAGDVASAASTTSNYDMGSGTAAVDALPAVLSLPSSSLTAAGATVAALQLNRRHPTSYPDPPAVNTRARSAAVAVVVPLSPVTVRDPSVQQLDGRDLPSSPLWRFVAAASRFVGGPVFDIDDPDVAHAT